MIRRLINYLIEGLVPNDDSLCLIARINGSAGFEPHSPAILTRLNDFEQGHRSPSITIGNSEYRFFASCTDLHQHYQGVWPYDAAEWFIQYTTYMAAVESIRDTYHQMREMDPDSLSPDERELHLQRLADMEEVAVAVERGRLQFMAQW
ncbi:hypothetical protein HJG54_14720 [Leptolyngbya sp. NK1-12]|uniref:Uncharacterized protein n=1 Tax=Leptolyngbya sp. NK1-12 TaxID=2547451 RepID=A0AA97AG70_9CYAN|nr:hypothetical protein [Leptolyngbya sp. NK1-12]WNZ23985.1 hypothetical protein HJG54_14720 [Leptolyngbya sp. NK1-12]